MRGAQWYVPRSVLLIGLIGFIEGNHPCSAWCQLCAMLSALLFFNGFIYYHFDKVGCKGIHALFSVQDRGL